VAVDLVPSVVDVRPRQLQVVLAQQHEEPLLEVAERDVGAERDAQLGDAGLLRIAGDAGLDVGRRHVVTDPRLVTRAGEPLG